MSQRNPASDPPSNAPRRDSQFLPPLSPSLSQPQGAHNAPSGSPYTIHPPSGLPTTTLPSLESVTSATRLPPLLTDPPPWRPLGVRSILNPSRHDPQTSFQAEPPTNYGIPSSAAPNTAIPPLTQGTKRPSRASPAAEEMQAFGGQVERRILTAKSPALRATSAAGRQNIASALFGVSGSPSLRGENRTNPTDPGPSKAPQDAPLPPPNPLGRLPYPSLTESLGGQSRRPSAGRNLFAAGGIHTQGESPSTSHSSYSRFSQPSPILRYRPSMQNPPSLQSGSARQPVSLPPGHSSTNLGEGQYDMSKGSYGISIPTEGGQMLLPVELDVEQASKTANEKRKRNAGASARFRQRRKEKEREASQTISSLERNLRALEDERNHYRSERDFYRDLCARQLGPAQMPQRPLTPRAQLVSRPSVGDTPPQWQDISRDTSESLPRSLRRRTNSYPANFSVPVAASPLAPPPAQAYGYGPQPPAHISQNTFPSRPPGAASFPPPPNQPPPSFPSQPAPNPHPPPSQDPFRRDMYSRSWNPGL